jgi:hypothetical protein
MALIAHQLIDALRGKSRRPPLKIMEGCPQGWQRLLIHDVSRAEKFEFVSLPLEPAAEPGVFRLPKLTRDEAEAWCEGLLPLPAPCVWYEFTYNNRSGLLLIEDGTKWQLERLEWLPGEAFVVFGVRVTIDRASFDPLAPIGEGFYSGNLDLIRRLTPEKRSEVFGHDALLAIYLTLVINSRSTEVTRESPPPQLNKARDKRGVTPLFDHRVVRIVPQRFLRGAPGGGTHASPRLHWRRSHIRTLYRGTPDERRILIPRCLVGRVELGTVSHEYRIT